MSDGTEGPAVGELVSKHEGFHEIAELRPSADGVCVVCLTEDGFFLTKASELSPAGAVTGVRIWK